MSYICKYCEKECKNANSLRCHERFCKANPNRDLVYISHLDRTGKSATVGKHLIHKGDVQRYVDDHDLTVFLNEGWEVGMKLSSISKLSSTTKRNHQSGIITGRAKTAELEEARKLKISAKMIGNDHWKFNNNRGNGKKGWYKGIFCDSAWELAFVVYNIDHNIPIQRCKQIFEYEMDGRHHTYHPDFITPEGIIEIKGIWNNISRLKHKLFPDIIIYDSIKMKPILDYVITTYGDDFWKKLYETTH